MFLPRMRRDAGEHIVEPGKRLDWFGLRRRVRDRRNPAAEIIGGSGASGYRHADAVPMAGIDRILGRVPASTATGIWASHWAAAAGHRWAVSVLLTLMLDAKAPAPSRVRAAHSVLEMAAKALEMEDIEMRLRRLEAESESATQKNAA